MTSSKFICDVLTFQIKPKEAYWGQGEERRKEGGPRIDICNTKFLFNYRKNVRG